MTERADAGSDLALMEYADGELDGQVPGQPAGEIPEASADAVVATRLERDPDARVKVAAIQQVGELVRGHLELSADAVHDAKFAAMWRRIDDQLEQPATGLWARLTRWFDQYRGHVITGAVSAGAVAALALVLRPGTPDPGIPGRNAAAIDVRPVALRATPEIDSLDTPGGSSTVINLDDDEDGHTTVIWVTPADTVEGL